LSSFAAGGGSAFAFAFAFAFALALALAFLAVIPSEARNLLPPVLH
jgi:formiminotetrahydrofolate cyclodeaminase